MLPFRLHPEADFEAIEAVEYIKGDDPYQAELFKEALKGAIMKARKFPLNY